MVSVETGTGMLGFLQRPPLLLHCCCKSLPLESGRELRGLVVFLSSLERGVAKNSSMVGIRDWIVLGYQGQSFLVIGDSRVCCRMLASNPGLCSLDVSKTTTMPSLTIKLFLDIAI